MNKLTFNTTMYERVAEAIWNEVEDKDFYNGFITIEDIDGNGTQVDLQLCLVIYRNKITYYEISGPEGGEITSILPVFYDCEAFVPDDDDELIKIEEDFYFAHVLEIFKKYYY